jgi:hypothetical protein
MSAVQYWIGSRPQTRPERESPEHYERRARMY